MFQANECLELVVKPNESEWESMDSNHQRARIKSIALTMIESLELANIEFGLKLIIKKVTEWFMYRRIAYEAQDIVSVCREIFDERLRSDIEEEL